MFIAKSIHTQLFFSLALFLVSCSEAPELINIGDSHLAINTDNKFKLEPNAQVYRGLFKRLSPAFTKINGRAVMTVSGEETKVRLIAKGLTKNTAYMAHMHVLPCSEGAGGHYKHDINQVETLEENEIWPLIYGECDRSWSG